MAKAATAPLNLTLNLSMQPQLQKNWCWAATSTSTSIYYDPKSRWTQCKVANAELNLTSCCKTGNSADCDRQWQLDKEPEHGRIPTRQSRN